LTTIPKNHYHILKNKDAPSNGGVAKEIDMVEVLEAAQESQSVYTRATHHAELIEFLVAWDEGYKSQMQLIPLFNSSLTGQWTAEQKIYFARIFYHSRGHFRDLLWHLGNFAPNKIIKEIILENIAEEFNGNGLSHEEMYLDFALEMGVDLRQEIIKEEYYTPEMREFNKKHVEWVINHDWKSNFAMFSAYERQDKTDYEFLSGLTEPEHMFFRIHRLALHFDKTYEVLQEIWQEDANIVTEAFKFIADTQVVMWRQLSDAVFAYGEKTN
jgi:hypothetical protein